MVYNIELPDYCNKCPLMSLETDYAYIDNQRVVIGHKCEHEGLCAILFKHFKELLTKEQGELG